MKNKQKIIVGIIIVIILIIGVLGTIGVRKMVEPSTRDKQINFLKEHENEITEYVKSKNPKSKISNIEYDLNSFSVENSGAFTQELYSVHINLYDKDSNKINGGSISIIPDDITNPNKIIELSTNNFDKELGE